MDRDFSGTDFCLGALVGGFFVAVVAFLACHYHYIPTAEESMRVLCESEFKAHNAVASPTSSTAKDDPWGMGSAILPPEINDTLMATRVVVTYKGANWSPAPLYLSRAAFSRLLQECKPLSDCDKKGVVISVTAGPDAINWGIPAGAIVELSLQEGEVDIPRSRIAGDNWFSRGIKVVRVPPVRGTQTE